MTQVSRVQFSSAMFSAFYCKCGTQQTFTTPLLGHIQFWVLGTIIQFVCFLLGSLFVPTKVVPNLPQVKHKQSHEGNFKVHGAIQLFDLQYATEYIKHSSRADT